MYVRNFAATAAKCAYVTTAHGETTFVAKCPAGEPIKANRPVSNIFFYGTTLCCSALSESYYCVITCRDSTHNVYIFFGRQKSQSDLLEPKKKNK